MPKTRLTDRAILSLKTDKVQEDHFDEVITGFGVRVFRTGRKSYFYLYRNENGQRRRFDIGAVASIGLADARQKARALAFGVSGGSDPSNKRRAAKASSTVADVAERFLESSRLNCRPKTHREDRRLMEKEVLPEWGRHKIESITRKDAVLLLERIRDRGAPVVANRTQQLLSRLFNFAADRELLNNNPCYRLRKVARERSRERVLTEDELKRFWSILKDTPYCPTIGALKLIVLTMQRSGEVKGMRWSEVRDGVWIIPSERMKNGKPQRVPLSEQALQVLAEARAYNARAVLTSRKSDAAKEKAADYVFPSRYSGPISEINKRLRSIVEAMAVPTFTAHDLRRTGSTFLQQMNVSHEAIEQILSHSLRGVAGVYQRGHRFDEVQRALARWGERVERSDTAFPEDRGQVVALR